MYKVINGKKYNTDTAKLLGTWHVEYSLPTLTTTARACTEVQNGQ